MSQYIQYYDEQVGGGRGGVRNVFAGSTYQRGRGVGAWLGGLFRKILPYLASGAKAVGKETLRAGLNVFDDVANDGANFNEAVKFRARESSKNLKRKAADKIADIMKGSGYKTTPRKRKRQSRKTSGLDYITAASSVKKRAKKAKGRRVSSVKKRNSSKKKKKKNLKFRNINDIFGPK